MVGLPVVGVVCARAEVDGLVTGPTGDVVVRAVNRHGVRPASELDVVVRPGPTVIVSLPLPTITSPLEPLPTITVSGRFPRVTLSSEPLPSVTESMPPPAYTLSLPFPCDHLSCRCLRITVI